MILIKKIAIIFFDLVDTYYHQKKIINFFLKRNIILKTLFDVGAHKGNYSNLFLNNYKNLKINLYEPQKKFFKILKKRFCKKKNIKIFNFGISNKDTRKIFFINEHDLTSSFSSFDENNLYLKFKAFLFGKNIKGMINKRIFIKTRKLNFCKNSKKNTKLDLVKIDTEGHELEVLQGMGKCIYLVKYILIEIHNDKIFKSYSSKHVHNYLIKKNFILQERFKFPFTKWEDRIYLNKKHEHSRASSKRNS